MEFPYGFNVADIQERIEPARLSEITGGDDSKVAKAAQDVAAEFELYAGKYYETPLRPFSAALRTVFLDLWQWRLIFNCQPQWLNTADAADDNYAIARRRKELLKWLEGLSTTDRTSTLPGCAEREAQRAGAGGAWSTAGRPVMTRASLLKLA